MIGAYLHQVLISLDQLANTLAGGWADETLSSRSWRLRAHWWYGFWWRVIDGLFFWQKSHCEKAYWNEMNRRQSPPELRGPEGA